MKKRVISAVVLLTIAVTCIFLSEITRVLFFAVAGIMCAYEYSRGLEKAEVYCAAWVMYTYIGIQAVLAILHAGTTAYIACMAAGVYLAMFSGILHAKVRGKGAIYTVAGLAYPGFIYGLMMMISASPRWLEVIALGCISSIVCDSFALFGGMRFGKHKVAPDVSPHKTVEGCICGAAAGALSGLLVKLIPNCCNMIPGWICVVTALVASSMGQIGDLSESLVKRMLGLKDFSKLIPGHGGMFDRTDSIMFAVPAAYLCLFLFGYA